MSYVKILTAALLSLAFSTGTGAFAETTNTSSFQNYKDVTGLTIVAPTVVEVPFESDYSQRMEFVVYENETATFEPSYFVQRTTTQTTPVSITSTPSASGISNMTDGRYETYTEYALPETYQGSVELTVQATSAVTTSAISLLLDNQVALPTSVEVRTRDAQGEHIVLARTRMSGQRITFPKTSSATWIIRLSYTQPLRIAELRLEQANVSSVTNSGLRFLARPQHTYRIYFNPDRFVGIKTQEAGNLSDNKGVVLLSSPQTAANPAYVKADVDGDSIPDERDNCVSTPNSDQVDIDANGRGDACDDFDRDGIMNVRDNCVDQPNIQQTDTDGDGLGDTCDGEESRITEKYTWIPWVGMGGVGLVIFILMLLTIKEMRKPKDAATKGEVTPPDQNTPPTPQA